MLSMIYQIIKVYLLQNKFQIILYICFSILLSILGIIAPFISGTFIDYMISNPTSAIIYNFTLIYVFVAILQLILLYICSLQSIKIKSKISFQLNSSLLRHLQKVSLMYIDSQNISYLNQRIYVDCNNLIDFFLSFIVGIIVNLISAFISMIIILKISVYMSVLILILIIAYLILYKLTKKNLENIKFLYKEISAKYFSSLQEQISNIRMIKLYSLYSFFETRLNTVYTEMLSILLKNQKISFIFQSSDTIINMSAQIILFLVGGLQIIEGSLSIGVFTIISAYFNNIVKATKYFINLGNEYVDTTISAKRIKELLDIPEQNNGNMRINNINTISLQNVSFGYTAKQIINEFNYTFKQNNIYIIKGKNGKGKSTLLNLMLGLHVEEYCGKILINNVDINHIDLINLRKLISFIPQNDFIIEGTVIDNITLDIQKDEMYERSIMKLCNQFCFSTSKYNHYIHENKNTFSGGEIKKSA